MTFRLISYTAYALCLLATVLIAAPYAKGQMTHEEHHPDWLRNSGCCGPEDTRKIKVRFVPGVGWAIVWIDNPAGLPVIRLRRPIRFDLERIRRSKDGNWWAGFVVRDGVAVRVWVIGGKICVFGHGSGQ